MDRFSSPLRYVSSLSHISKRELSQTLGDDDRCPQAAPIMCASASLVSFATPHRGDSQSWTK